MKMKKIIEIIEEKFSSELANTRSMFAGHDPFAGHRPCDAGTKSKFRDIAACGCEVDGDWTDETGDTRYVTLFFKGENGDVLECGVKTETFMTTRFRGRPDAETELVVEEVHGCKQLVAKDKGDWSTIEVDVEIATAVVTKEKGDVWCLASAYPGRPGTEPRQLGRFELGTVLTVRYAPAMALGETARIVSVNGTPADGTLDVSHVVLEEVAK